MLTYASYLVTEAINLQQSAKASEHAVNNLVIQFHQLLQLLTVAR